MKLILTILALVVMTGVASADDNIVIVFDTSGSMSDSMRSAGGKSRMQVAQDALISVLSKVPKSTKVGVLTFNGWIYDIQPVDQAKLEAAIRATRPSGGTPLYQYIGSGATRLLKERDSQGNAGSYKLLVVTDGAASDDSLNVERTFGDGTPKPGVLQDVLNRGIVIDAIGLDMADKHALSTQINGVYMLGNDPNSLSKAIAKSVAEVGFGSTQDASDEAFKEISELPEEFVLASLKGLTTFANQPIGEKPPLEVKQADGTTMIVPNPANETSSGPMILLGVVCVLGVIVVAAVAASRS